MVAKALGLLRKTIVVVPVLWVSRVMRVSRSKTARSRVTTAVSQLALLRATIVGALAQLDGAGRHAGRPLRARWHA